jgi:hypothetical protein
MKKLAIVFIVVAFAFMGCTRASRASISKGFKSGNGGMERHIVVTNSRTDSVVWEFTGKASIKNAVTGDYDIMVFTKDWDMLRVLFNGRDLTLFSEELE